MLFLLKALLGRRRLCQGLDGDLCCEDEGKAKEMFSTSSITHLNAREREMLARRQHLLLVLNWLPFQRDPYLLKKNVFNKSQDLFK